MNYPTISDHAHLAAGSALTTAGATGAFTLWGLHASEWAVIVSAACAVIGVLINGIVAVGSFIRAGRKE